jgi:hypothetical protein
LKDMGVNTIRLYSLNPLTEKASESRVGTGGIVHAFGKSHIEFFDACQAAGIKVIAPLVSNDANVLLNDNITTWQQKVTDLVAEIGSHPALLAFYVGSDWGLESASQETLATTVNDVLGFARARTSVPLTHCVSNLPDTADFFSSHINMDFVCANAGWEGPEGVLSFLGNSSSTSTWGALALSKGWPIVIGEAGVAGLDANYTLEHPTWFNDLWKQTLDLDSQGVVGSVFFEYNDEPYSPVDWKRTLGATYFIPAVDAILNSTQENIFWADTLLLKDGIFNAIKSGSINQTEINYNSDVYSYLGREPTTVSTPINTQTPSPAAPLLEPFALTLSVIFALFLVFFP